MKSLNVPSMYFILTFMLFASMSFSLRANEKSLYNFSWLDQDKEIYVLQNRKFVKDGNFYLSLNSHFNLNQPFIKAMGGNLRGGYFFNEDWGLELVHGRNSSQENDTAKGVLEQGTVPFYRQVESYTGGMLLWSPFYSKINTFNKVFYFDWIFGLGISSITTQDNRNKFDTTSLSQDELTKEVLTGALWNTGFRVFLSHHFSLRFDLTGLTYSAEKKREVSNVSKSTSKIYSNIDLSAGLIYSF